MCTRHCEGVMYIPEVIARHTRALWPYMTGLVFCTLATCAYIARCNNGMIVVLNYYIFQSSYLRFEILDNVSQTIITVRWDAIVKQSIHAQCYLAHQCRVYCISWEIERTHMMVSSYDSPCVNCPRKSNSTMGPQKCGSRSNSQIQPQCTGVLYYAPDSKCQEPLSD
jgi:hypothetical protein